MIKILGKQNNLFMIIKKVLSSYRNEFPFIFYLKIITSSKIIFIISMKSESHSLKNDIVFKITLFKD